jgi:hypothetical protein
VVRLILIEKCVAGGSSSAWGARGTNQLSARCLCVMCFSEYLSPCCNVVACPFDFVSLLYLHSCINAVLFSVYSEHTVKIIIL